MLDSLQLSPSQRNILETATAQYEQSLDQAASFLSARGIGRDAATGSRLGVVSDPIPGHERFVGMLSLPYLTPAGVVAIKFRQLDSDIRPKYDAPSGQHARLYNTAALLGDEPIVALCEGELDALVCSAVVGVPAAGTPGTQWQEHWSRCFADKDQVLVIADHDVKDDGSSPGLKHGKKLAGLVPNGRVVMPPPGMDLNDWVLEEGADAVRKAMGV